MRKTKYIGSGGLAFDEEKDMERLSKYASEGWILEKFAFLGFKLRKGKSESVDFSVAYESDPDEDYFAYFEAAGWKHVCSTGNYIHIFSAPKNTTPIYTDKASIFDKYEKEKRKMADIAFPSLIFMAILFILESLSNLSWVADVVGTISLVLACLTLIVLVFTGLPYFGYQYKLYKLRK
ncbi:DUF2812 domain-containing protein [Halobacillus campisalis]|uniref:DUF2812 domain-containing protein n=1 Tax=Halobacillus campisalis TaxID=435909 RepID=A0ABW2K9Z7_9BACI|nr:DUF2812 domain-containing protein [Halobacillus campisalis]